MGMGEPEPYIRRDEYEALQKLAQEAAGEYLYEALYGERFDCRGVEYGTTIHRARQLCEKLGVSPDEIVKRFNATYPKELSLEDKVFATSDITIAMLVADPNYSQSVVIPKGTFGTIVEIVPGESPFPYQVEFLEIPGKGVDSWYCMREWIERND